MTQIDDIETVEDFADALREVHVRSGKSMREIEQWSSRLGSRTLPRSSISEMLRGRRLPTRAALRSFLEATGVSPAEASKWEDARARIATKQFSADTASPETLARLTPPQDVAAERSTLGGMLLSADVVADVVGIVRAEDFSRSDHVLIFKAIVDLYARDEPIDLVTVSAALAANGQLAKVGDRAHLKVLTEAIPDLKHAGRYARIVAEQSQLRHLMEAGLRIARLAAMPPDGTPVQDVDDVVELARRTVLDAANSVVAARVERTPPLAELLQPTLDQIEAMGTGQIATVGIPTGFTDLDRLLNGFRPGQVIAVAGEVGVGKSILALNFARNAAIKHQLSSAFFTAEMTTADVVMRLLAAEARVPLHVLRSGQLTDGDWKKLAERMAEISEAPLFIDDSAEIGSWEIWKKCIELDEQHDLKLIVVDSPMHLHQANTSEFMQDLKLLARRLDCAVVVVSPATVRPGRVPWLNNLPEAVSAISDTVIVLHREDHHDMESPRAGEADLFVVKQRNGPCDVVTVAAQLHLSRFVDIAI